MQSINSEFPLELFVVSLFYVAVDCVDTQALSVLQAIEISLDITIR